MSRPARHLHKPFLSKSCDKMSRLFGVLLISLVSVYLSEFAPVELDEDFAMVSGISFYIISYSVQESLVILHQLRAYKIATTDEEV